MSRERSSACWQLLALSWSGRAEAGGLDESDDIPREQEILSMKQYTASVVGGGFGGRLSIDALRSSERFEPVAAADVSPTARDALTRDYPGLEIFDSHEAMFAARPTDVVCVSTWPPSHRAVAEAALKLPLKGILVEKPLADTTADGAAILHAVKSRGRPLAVPHGLLAMAHADEIRERTAAGEIGDLILIGIECSGWDIINAGIHWLNFAYLLNGTAPIRSVLAACDVSSRTYRDGVQVETAAVTYAQAANGVRIVMNTGDYVTTTREGKETVFHIVGTKGTIEFWAWQSAYRIVSPTHPEGLLVKVPYASVAGHRRHLERMAEEIDAGTATYDVAESSLAALEMCEAAYVSCRHHCQVNLPLATFVPPPVNDWEPGKPYSGTGGGRDGRNLPPAGEK
jgi:predicted dehydrogenase